MFSGFGYEMAKLRGQELTREAEIDRLARLAMAPKPQRLRKGLGRGLVRLGLLVAGVCRSEMPAELNRAQVAR